jgi:hypothetical protein
MLNYRAIANKLAIENEGLKRQLEGKDVLIRALVEKVYSLEDTIKKMEEEMGTLKRMHFGTSSEKTHSKVSNESAKADNEPNPICFRNKQWDFIKLEMIDFVSEI